MKKILLLSFLFLALPAIATAEPAEIWLGLGGCETDRRPFRLTVMEDGSIRLSGTFAPQVMTGAIEGPDVALEFSGWLSRRRPNQQQPRFAISARADQEKGLLIGTMQGRDTCDTFVAKRVAVPPPAPRPGLLAKVAAAKKVRDTLTAQDCEVYLDWLADGELVAPIGDKPRLHSALRDQARMQAIFGTDIYRWGSADTDSMKKLQECRRMFRRSDDPRQRQLLETAQRIAGIVPEPLRYDPYPHGSSKWIYAFALVHADVYEELERLLRVASASPDAALSAGGAATFDGAAPIADGRAEEAGASIEWIGVMSCQRSDAYLKVTQSEAEVTLETGAGLFGMLAHAILRMEGRVAEGRFALDPQDWIVRSNSVIARPQPVALRGNTTAGLEEISGTIEGATGCTEFRAYRNVPPPLALQTDGLLFRGRLDPDACLALAGWLAEGKEDRIGQIRFNTLILDDARIEALFGKATPHWKQEDVNRFRGMTSSCRSEISKSARLEHRALIEGIADWTVAPLSSQRDGRGSAGWQHYELIRVMGAEAERRREAKLAEVRALPAAFASLTAIDRLNEQTKKAEGALRYLRQSSRDAHLRDMVNARDEVAQRIAVAELASLDSHPRSLAGLLEAEREADRIVLRLEEHGAPQAAREMASGFDRIARDRALEVWDMFLAEAAPRLEALAEKDYRSFDEISKMRRTAETLLRFARPGEAPTTRAAYDAHTAAMALAVDHMVSVSLPGILAWIEALPLSLAGLGAADDLLATTFPRPMASPAARRLAEAVAAKHAIYNPRKFLRPDVIYGFARSNWADVDFRGLDNLAYVSTLLKSFRETCPMALPVSDRALSGFVLSGAHDATDRLMRGEVRNRAEAQRAVMLMANTIFNQPGCEADFFGNPTSNCTTQEGFAAVTQLFMTSGPALSDARSLLGKGCTDADVVAVGQGAAAFVDMRPHSGALPVNTLPRLADFLIP